MPFLRFITNILLTKFINLLLRNNASEYFSGLRGMKVEKLKEINLKKLANNWIIEQEIHFIFIKKIINLEKLLLQRLIIKITNL